MSRFPSIRQLEGDHGNRFSIIWAHWRETIDCIAGLKSGHIYPWGRSTKQGLLKNERAKLRRIKAAAEHFGIVLTDNPKEKPRARVPAGRIAA